MAVGEGSVWVANAGDGTVTRIDPARATVVGDPIPVGRDPRELAVGEGFVWVANAGDGTSTNSATMRPWLMYARPAEGQDLNGVGCRRQRR